MLVGQGEELADGLGADGAHGLEEAFDNGAEHLVGFQVERAAGEAGVAAVEHGGAEEVEAIDGAGHEGADEGFGGGVSRDAGQFVEVALNRLGGLVVAHGWQV